MSDEDSVTYHLKLSLLVLLAGCASRSPSSDAAADRGADVLADRAPVDAGGADVLADRVPVDTGGADVSSHGDGMELAVDAPSNTDRLELATVDGTTVDVSPVDVTAMDALPESSVDAAAREDAPPMADVRGDVVGTVPPDFMLPDRNPNSATHRMTVSPVAQRGSVSVWYFASAT